MNNIKKIQNELHGHGLDAMLLINPVNRLYATGFNSTAGALLITCGSAWLVIDPRYLEAAQASVSDADVVALPKNERLDERIKALIVQTGVTAVGFEDWAVTHRMYNKWLGMFSDIPGIVLHPAQKLINPLRDVKSRDELGCMIKAQRIAEKVFEEILPLINTDITEKDLAAEIIYRSYKNGADKESFDPIVVSGPNSSRPHGVPGRCNISKGFLTLDFGVVLNGWCSDMTRTLCIGKPSDEMVKVYNTVLQAQEAGIAAVRGGVRGVDVDAAARRVIEAAGYGEYFGHGFGHSLGLEVHEPLGVRPLSEDILPAGAVISAEPGIYIPGRFGVRIEDVLYITDGGCENITEITKELIVISGHR